MNGLFQKNKKYKRCPFWADEREIINLIHAKQSPQTCTLRGTDTPQRDTRSIMGQLCVFLVSANTDTPGIYPEILQD
ncbi:hypothetical protein [Brachymonas denitrificans]|jgi:hypothetical protein|uniref:hypothetical protein n=1 Tax=Brachymonas denitrificans TaxID=28220 RepID=UPI001BD0B5F3|nr:hypothetical protein [Brachymonas denitrificans]